MQEDTESYTKGKKRTWGDLEHVANDLGSDDDMNIDDEAEQSLEPVTKVVKYTLPSPPQPLSSSEGVQEFVAGPSTLAPEERAEEAPTSLVLSPPWFQPPTFDRESLGWERSELRMLARLKEFPCAGKRTLQPNPFHPANRRRQYWPFYSPVVRICFIMRSFEDPTGTKSPRLKVEGLTKLDDVFEWYFHKAYPGLPILPVEAYDDQQTGDSYYLVEVDLAAGTLGGRYGYRCAKDMGLRLRDTEWWGRGLTPESGLIWLVGCDRVQPGTQGFT